MEEGGGRTEDEDWDLISPPNNICFAFGQFLEYFLRLENFWTTPPTAPPNRNAPREGANK